MPYPEQSFASIGTPIAFPIRKSDGEKEDEFYVGDGVCYSTYSLETGSFLNIEGLNEDFSWSKNEKIYIEIDVGLNLGPKNAKLRHAEIGDNAPDDGWKNYPYFYKIEPEDTIDENGVVKKIRDGKRQTKCYVLIGYLQDDNNKNGDLRQDSENSEDGGNDEEDTAYAPVQILKENVLLVQSVVSGIPCLVPFPYFNGGLTHLLSIKTDME